MKEIILDRLKIENFKGIKNTMLYFRPGRNEIVGNNQVGKSSIYDAYMFLLLGTDSLYSSKFNILPRIEYGRIRESFVEGSFDILNDDDNKPKLKGFTLRRIYRAKKGDIDTSLEASGATSAFYINDKKVNKTKYSKFVQEILSFDMLSRTDMWQILSDPNYFSQKLPKQEQRSFILNIIGNVSQEEIIAENPNLSMIKDICNGTDSLVKRQALIKDKNKLNSDMESNPIKINELIKIIDDYDIEDLDAATLKKETQKIEGNIGNIYTQIATNPEEAAQKQAISDKLSEISSIKDKSVSEEMQISDLKNKMELEKRDKLREIENEIYKIESQKDHERRKKVKIETEKIEKETQTKEEIEKLKQELENYKNVYKNLKKNYEESPTNCFNCQQPLPEKMLNDAKEKYLIKIEKIKEDALKTKNKIIANQQLLESNNTNGISDEAANSLKNIAILDKKYKTLQNDAIAIEEEYTKKIEDIKPSIELETMLDQANKELEALQNQQLSQKTDNVLQEKLESLQKRKKEINDNLNKIEYINDIKDRIEKRNEKQQSLVKQYHHILANIALLDEYHNVQAKMLEERINKSLKFGEIKLFEPLVQGGLQPTCALVHNGVDYASLNRASKIKAGTALIEAISKALHIQVPLWIDEAESIQQMLSVSSQLIMLSVLNDNALQLATKMPHYHSAQPNLYLNYKDQGQITWAAYQ